MLVTITSARPPATRAARVVGDSSDQVFLRLFGIERHGTGGVKRRAPGGTITAGGAVAGVGIEATSFRHGLVHHSVTEMQVLLADGGADLARRGTYHTRWFAVERVLTPGTAGPVNRVLERPWNRAVVLRRHEQDGIDARDRFLECDGRSRIVLVVVIRVQWQIADWNLVHRELGGRETCQRHRELSVDGVLREATDEEADGEWSHWIRGEGRKSRSEACAIPDLMIRPRN